MLAASVPGRSRGRARLLLDVGGVFVERTRVKVASRRLPASTQVKVYIGGGLERAPARPTTTGCRRSSRCMSMPLWVIDKPAALISPPRPRAIVVNAGALLAAQLGEPIFVVHRLDLGTSGLLVRPAPRRPSARCRRCFSTTI